MICYNQFFTSFINDFEIELRNRQKMIGTTQFTHERLAEDAPIFQKVCEKNVHKVKISKL